MNLGTHPDITEIEIYDFVNNGLSKFTQYQKCDAIVSKPIMTIEGTASIPPGLESNLKGEFEHIASQGWIDTSDIDFFMKQQSLDGFQYHSERLKKRIVSNTQIDSIFNIRETDGYEILKNELNIRQIGYLSKPYFSLDKNTVIIVFEQMRGFTFGQGYILIYKKQNGSWIEFQKLGTWES